ncbi:MAG: putative DNA binding domain-containing protein [Candidatus Cloacimonetes bacterium]|nr:putative DNA binding domain-containing protein [Candidatus Cloacimonadota bacterium]
MFPISENLIKTVIAFSNTAGGKIIIGINDDREVVGIDENIIFDLSDRISSIIYDSCSPNIIPEIYTQHIENKTVLVIEIFRGNLLPYYIKSKGKNKGTYIRIGATNRPAGDEIIFELERQRRNISFDEEADYQISLKNKDYLPLKIQFKAIEKNLKKNDLLNLKLLILENKQIYPSKALLILLGIYDNVKMKCARFKGNDTSVFLDRKEYKGDLFEQLSNAEKFIKNHIQLRGEIKGLQRTDTYEIPTEAIREALVNAIVHRDYVNQGRDIKVAVFDDRVSIVSPGGFPKTITENDILQGRSEIRNKITARIFKELKYIEQWGTGIQRIITVCKKADLPEPQFNETGDFVEVILYKETKIDSVTYYDGKRPNKTTENDRKRPIRTDYNDLSNFEKTVMIYIEKNESITKKIVKQLISCGDTKAKEILKGLLTRKLIVKKGNGRSTHYKINISSRKEE